MARRVVMLCLLLALGIATIGSARAEVLKFRPDTAGSSEQPATAEQPTSRKRSKPKHASASKRKHAKAKAKKAKAKQSKAKHREIRPMP